MEKIYNSDREAPIFEFRDLFDIKTSDFGQWMSDVDSAIQKLHNDFANAPNKLKRADNCQAPKPTTTTAPAVKCYHAASPRHTCAAIANDGWCDCGDSNKYQKMTEPGSVCEWTTLPPTKSYDCPAATTMVTTTSAPATTTTAPPPPPVPSCPVDKYPQCDKCPGGWNVDKCVATEASAACRCNDPCGDITCLFS